MNNSDTTIPPPSGRVMTRAEVQRDLQRTTTSVVILLAVVLALAAAAVFAGIRATQNLKRAEAAETQSRDRLWNSLIAQARAVRLTPEAGRRQAALSVLSNAANIRVSTALRTEAISAMALTDIQVEGPLHPIPRGTVQVELDTPLERYAYGDGQGNVYVCRLSDGSVLNALKAQELGDGTKMMVRSVAFSPDGSKLAVRYDGGAMVIWRLDDEKLLLKSGTEVTNVIVAGMSFWPDRDAISYGDATANGQISVYDFSTGEHLGPAIRVGARSFRFRPGTMEVAIATDNHVDIFDYPAETKKQTLETATRVFTQAWSPSGDELAIATEDGDVYLWAPGPGTHRILRGHSEPCVRLTFSPDGKLLATGSRDGTTRLWDIAQAQTIVVSSEGIAHVFSPDGGRLGLWRPSVGFGTWKLGRSDCFSQLVCPKDAGAFLSLDLSPSGRWCLATQSKGVRIWDLWHGDAETFIPLNDVANVRITPDETALLVCRRNGLERWSFGSNATGGLVVGNHEPQTVPLPDDRGARALAISLDGNHVVVELTDSRIAILELARSNPPVFLQETCRFISARTPGSATGAGRFSISPDGRWVATGFGVGREDKPKIWDAQTGALITTLPVDSSVVAFSPDGKWLGSAGIASFALWSVGDWKPLKKFQRDEPAVTHGSMAFLQGRTEVAITRSRQQAQLRDVFTDEKFADFVPPQLQSVNSIRMALDGSVLVTASATDKLQVWRLRTIRSTLDQLGLISPRAPKSLPPPDALPGMTQWVLIGSTAGFGIAAIFGLLTLRRHRAAISGFLAAEARAAERNRELEVAKVELMHSQKMQALGTLATGIAHDFNNLLSVIRMSNKLVGRAAKTDPEIQEHVADIEQAVLQGKSVVGSMLGYARTDAGEGKPTDISTVVEEAVSLLSKEFLSGIALTLELDREAPPVSIGRGRIEQILLNLLVNASEAMAGRGKLRITVHARSAAPLRPYVLRPAPAARYVELSVVDSGAGIAAEIRDRLFEPFFTTKRAGATPGTGLGLSLVYSIAQQESLGLSVESELGKGAAFTLVIPVQT